MEFIIIKKKNKYNTVIMTNGGIKYPLRFKTN